MLESEILEYYTRGLEQSRLLDARRSVEYWRTLDILHRHLPPAPATILDIGGGPGIYAFALAEAGYNVTLLDPVPLHTDQARAASKTTRHPLSAIFGGDARDLPVPGPFDAVLLLGPLYHLTAAAHRQRAWAEAVRVTRPGGVIVAAAASRHYACWETLTSGKLSMPGVLEALETQLATGLYRSPGQQDGLWTTAYFHTPAELEAEAITAGLTVRVLLAVEGPAKLLPDIAHRMSDPTLREQLLETQRRIEAEPAVLGLSQHVLAIAEKDPASWMPAPPAA